MKDYDQYVNENSLGYTEMIVLTQSCHSLVAHLMTNETIKTSKIKELIKVFLGTCHYYMIIVRVLLIANIIKVIYCYSIFS